MTAGKMRQYRKDRLFANDKEKTECLVDVLKNVRITDESAYFNSNKANERQSSPPHSPNQGHRNNIPRSGGGPSAGGGAGGSSIGGAGGYNSGAKGGSTFTPSGEQKQRGQSGSNHGGDQSHHGKQHQNKDGGQQQDGTMNSISSMYQKRSQSTQNQKGDTNTMKKQDSSKTQSVDKTPRLGKLRGLSPQQ